MKNLLLILASFLISFAYGQSADINIIPKPVSVQVQNGTFTLSGDMDIGYNKPEAAHVAEMLAGKLSVPTGYTLKAVQENKGKIQLNLNTPNDQEIGNEGYRMSVTPDFVVINANKPAGLFYGMQTLMQLLPEKIESPVKVNAEWTIPAVKITDYPRFGWRGLMLDVSRHFFTKTEVEKYIDLMSAFKFNTFHWHLTDDQGWRIEIKSLPELTETGACRVPRTGKFGSFKPPQPGEKATDCGFYTQDDIREIVQYAKDRYITILPEIDVPGHSLAAIASYPWLSCTDDTTVRVNPGARMVRWNADHTKRIRVDNTLNPSDEKVYEFLDKVFTEVAALFPGEYIHVGGDECRKDFWAKDEGCQKLMKKLKTNDIEKLQSYFMGRVEKILNAKGKKLIGWDEILEGGLSPGATVMSWRGIKGGIKAAGMHHDVVMTPTTYAYLDYTQGDPTIDNRIYARLRMEKSYSFNPVPQGVDPQYILGGQGNLWTEHLPTFRSIEYMTYPRALALSEDFWTPNNEKNWKDFIARVENQFRRWDVTDVDYSKAIYDPIVKSSVDGSKLTLDISTEDPALKVYFTIDDTMPDNHSPEYTGPVVMPDNPFTARVIAYKNGQPVSHLIVLSRDQLKKRSNWK